MPKYLNYPQDKYHPWHDVDGNGVIIITDFTQMGEIRPDEVMLFNISKFFTEEGLPSEIDPAKSVTFDMLGKLGKSMVSDDLDFVITQIEALYTNKINSLCLRAVPGLSYESIAGFPIDKKGAVQWDRSDFNKIIAHLRMLYDATLTKQ